MPASVRAGWGVLTGLLLTGGQMAQAQSCLGLPDLATTSRVLSTSATGSGADRALLGRFGMNGARAFAGVQAGYTAYEFKKPKAAAFGIDAGYAFALGRTSGIELCPVFQSVYQPGPNTVASHQTLWTTTLALGLGRNFDLSRSVALVPFVQGGLLQRHRTFGATDVLDQNGNSVWGASNKVLGQARIGVGLRVGNVLTLTPSFTMPFGAGPHASQYQGGGIGYEPGYSLSAAFKLRP